MELTADASIAIVKAALYGIPKSKVAEITNARAEKLYDDTVAQLRNGDKILDIPSDDPDLRGTEFVKVVYEEK